MATAVIKTILVTGANSGIGFEACRKLCAAGHRVIATSRDLTRGQTSIDKIKASLPAANIDLVQLDLSKEDSIRSAVKIVYEKTSKLDVLVNNAGATQNFESSTRVMLPDKEWEITMASNFLGPFLLTYLLRDMLKSTADENGHARIVNVASSLHKSDPNNKRMPPTFDIDIDDLFYAKNPARCTGIQAYKDSKLGNVIFSLYAPKVLPSNVTINAMCPGFIPATELSRNAPFLARLFMKYLLPFFISEARTVDDGANEIVRLATSSELDGVTGKYFQDYKVGLPSEEAGDDEVQKKLWNKAIELWGLKNTEWDQ